MRHLEVSGAVRPLKWPFCVKWLMRGLGTYKMWRKCLRLSQKAKGLLESQKTDG